MLQTEFNFLRYKTVKKNEIHVYKQTKVNTSTNKQIEYEQLNLNYVQRLKENFGVCFNSFV